MPLLSESRFPHKIHPSLILTSHQIITASIMVYKVYGILKSIATKRVTTVLYETGSPFELIEVNALVGVDNKKPEHLEKQPFGQIPVLVRPVPLSPRSDHILTLESIGRR
jgi:hypothetical protein